MWCATSPKLADVRRVYCENVEVAGIVPPGERSRWASDDSTRLLGVMPFAVDADNAQRLWGLSEELLAIASAKKKA